MIRQRSFWIGTVLGIFLAVCIAAVGVAAGIVSLKEKKPEKNYEELGKQTQYREMYIDFLCNIYDGMNRANGLSIIDLDYNDVPELIVYYPGMDNIDIFTIEENTVCAFSRIEDGVPKSANQIEINMLGMLGVLSPRYLTDSAGLKSNTKEINNKLKSCRGIFQFEDKNGDRAYYLHSGIGTEDRSDAAWYRFYGKDGKLAAEKIFTYAKYASFYSEKDLAGKYFINGEATSEENYQKAIDDWETEFASTHEVVELEKTMGLTAERFRPSDDNHDNKFWAANSICSLFMLREYAEE